GGQDDGGQQREDHVEVGLGPERGDGVGADAHEGELPEVGLAEVAGEQVQADRGDADGHGEDDHVAEAGVQGQQPHQGKHQQDGDRHRQGVAVGAGGEPHGCYRRSATSWPKRPLGRTRRVRISRAKMAMIENSCPRSTLTTFEITPTTTPPTKAPGRLVIPPSRAAVKANRRKLSIMSVESRAEGTVSKPTTTATKPAMSQARPLRPRMSAPRSRAMSGRSAIPRSRSPGRVRL